MVLEIFDAFGTNERGSRTRSEGHGFVWARKRLFRRTYHLRDVRVVLLVELVVVLSSSSSMTASTTGALPFCDFSRFTALASRADPEGPALARPRRPSAGASSASRADAVRLRASRDIACEGRERARAV
jgi:hypothetical protein